MHTALAARNDDDPRQSPTGRITSRGDIVTAGEQLRSSLSKKEEKPSFSGVFAAYSSSLAGLKNLIETINGLALGEPTNGEALFGLAMRSAVTVPNTGAIRDLVELYKRSRPTPQGDSRFDYPPFLQGCEALLVSQAVFGELPEPEMYLMQSSKLSASLTEIQGRLSEKQAKLVDLEKRNIPKVRDVPGQGQKKVYPFAEGVANLQAEVAAIKGEIKTLFGALTDVRPEEIPPVLAQVGAKVSASSTVTQSVVQFVRQLERFIAELIEPAKEAGTISLTIPAFKPNGTMGKFELTCDAKKLDGIRQQPANLVQLFRVYLESREFLQAMLLTFPFVPAVARAEGEIVDVLKAPFRNAKEGPESVFNKLIANDHPEIKELTLRLLSEKPPGQDSKRVVESARSSKPLLWVANSYVYGDDQTAAGHERLLRSIPSFKNELFPCLERVRELLSKKDFEALARLANEKILALLESSELPDIISPLIMLSALHGDEKAREQIRNQIPNLTELKSLADKVVSLNKAWGQEFDRLSHILIKAFGVSLADLYRGPEMAELWEFVETFKLFLEHPECIAGLEGDEAMESGVLLAGIPGVGKTYFATSLARELNLKMFSISQEKGDQKSTNLNIAACQKVIEQAKDYAAKFGACMLFIDEAEAVMPRRDLPTTTGEQADLTCYLLQQINELRRSHPKILIVAATNYPDKIDEGMLRDGRFDIQVVVGRPTPLMREALITRTLEREKLDLKLTGDDMKELIKATEGLLPLTIKRVILKANRIERHAAAVRGKEFGLDVKKLKSRYEHQSQKRQKSLVERYKEKLASDEAGDEKEAA